MRGTGTKMAGGAASVRLIVATAGMFGLLSGTAVTAAATPLPVEPVAIAVAEPGPGGSTTYEDVPMSAEMCEAVREVDPESDCLEQIVSTESYEYNHSYYMEMPMGATRCKSFVQTRQNKNGPRFWSFTQRGEFCYNGVSLWRTYQNCQETEGYGFAVTVLDCSFRRLTTGTKPYKFTNTARTSFVFRGFPAHAHLQSVGQHLPQRYHL